MKPVIALTMGDPAGIGPEIILKAAAHPAVRRAARLVVFGDARHLSRVMRVVKKRLSLSIVDFRNVNPRGFRFGVATRAGGKASGDYIVSAVEAARFGLVDAVVTAPINKDAFRMGGWAKNGTGHTEFLAKLTRTNKFALMLAHGPLRAVHVTSHIPLKDVARSVTARRIVETIRLTHEALRSMGIRKPRIAVCALNPHAGENGLLGKEEKRVIAPAVRTCRKLRIDVSGPLPADTLWPRVAAGEFDAGIAMYHDQGQIPVKLAGLKGVNVTLGLPLIRTSPAHGTAYDIAGKGIASEESLANAILTAVQMVNSRLHADRNRR